MPKLIRPPNRADVTRFMRMLFMRTERELIKEISRKRNTGLVEYAEAASLERVQKILQNMVDESWSYVPQMIETIFYRSDKDAAGYRNARTLTAPQTAVVQQLADNLLGELTEAAEGAKKSAETVFTIARLEKDPLRETALKQVLRKEAAGKPWIKTSEDMLKEMKANGITVFVDKAGRRWNMETYCNMVTRTTARQAQVAALLTADDHDLWQIVKIGSTCPVCAALEGRVYSKSGTDPDYPPLSLAFGKVDPTGAEDLTNTYLNIHPSCLHSLIKYTTIGKTEKQIQKDKDFSDPDKNPLDRDPRTKKQIKAYREKERNRRKLLADLRQHKEYRSILGNEVPKDFDKFREMKYNDPEKWKALIRKKGYSANPEKLSKAVSGARNPYGKAASEHAERYYGLVRSMSTDVRKIAKTTGYSESEIQKIKNYIFIDEHDLGDRGLTRFDPDYMMGESWRRLMEGKPESHDLTLIHHEIMERELVEQGVPQDEAHILTTAKYNYDKEAMEYYGKIEKFKKE